MAFQRDGQEDDLDGRKDVPERYLGSVAAHIAVAMACRILCEIVHGSNFDYMPVCRDHDAAALKTLLKLNMLP
jgi:hypothetical protein